MEQVSSLNQNGWRKGLAIAMLLWAMLDLAVPGFCSEGEAASDTHGLPASVLVTEGPCYHPAPETASIESSHPSDPRQGGDDDCWCCCSHIAPADVATLAELAILGPEELPSHFSAPKDWAPFLYHPPRS